MDSLIKRSDEESLNIWEKLQKYETLKTQRLYLFGENIAHHNGKYLQA